MTENGNETEAAISDNTSGMDKADIPNVRDLIADGNYNDDVLPPTQVPGTGIVDREIESDRFKARVEQAREQDDPISKPE
ncbi:MAG: hypothetical protein AAGG45_06975 [Pseudomonadota bacterium]